MNVVFATLLLVTAANLALALFVLWHRPRAEVNRVFALTALAIAGWTLTNALFQQTPSVATATLVAQFSYLSGVVLGASFLHFSWVFPLRRTVLPRHKTLLWCAALLVGVLPFVPRAVIRSINLGGNRSIDTALGIWLVALFMVASLSWAFGGFVRRHPGLREIAREQSRYVLVGSALTAVIGLTCNLLLPLLGNYWLVWLGPASSLFFVGFTVYAIIAHHLFDIRLIIKRTLLYGMLVAGIAAGYSAVEQLLTETLRQATQGSRYSWVAGVIGAVAVSVCAAPLRHWIEDRLDRIVYSSGNKEDEGGKARASKPEGARTQRTQ